MTPAVPMSSGARPWTMPWVTLEPDSGVAARSTVIWACTVKTVPGPPSGGTVGRVPGRPSAARPACWPRFDAAPGGGRVGAAERRPAPAVRRAVAARATRGQWAIVVHRGQREQRRGRGLALAGGELVHDVYAAGVGGHRRLGAVLLAAVREHGLP